MLLAGLCATVLNVLDVIFMFNSYEVADITPILHKG